jgi:TolA-binding protein
MAVAETLLIYAVLGISVAIAVRRIEPDTSMFDMLTHALFWPFFAPTLFAPPGTPASPEADAPQSPELTPTANHPDIRETERSLLETLSRLDGLAEDVLAPDLERIHDLFDSLDRMQTRLDEMNEMLDSDEFDEQQARGELERTRSGEACEARRESAERRLRHIHRLQEMRRNLERNLQTALGKVDEITTQIALLRFADHPDRKVSKLIEDIAATVDGVSEGVLE